MLKIPFQTAYQKSAWIRHLEHVKNGVTKIQNGRQRQFWNLWCQMMSNHILSSKFEFLTLKNIQIDILHPIFNSHDFSLFSSPLPLLDFETPFWACSESRFFADFFYVIRKGVLNTFLKKKLSLNFFRVLLFFRIILLYYYLVSNRSMIFHIINWPSSCA